MKVNFRWKKKTGQYQTGESLYLGKIVIGGYEWNGIRDRNVPKNVVYSELLAGRCTWPWTESAGKLCEERECGREGRSLTVLQRLGLLSGKALRRLQND